MSYGLRKIHGLVNHEPAEERKKNGNAGAITGDSVSVPEPLPYHE
jgi:hypothetical protein